MECTKKSFIEVTKGQFNSIREFNGLLIRMMAWKNDPWTIVTRNDFSNAEAIMTFHTREELWSYIKNNNK